MRLLPLTGLLLLASSLAGCAGDAAGLFGGGGNVDAILGQTIIFVGTDSTTLETNIYQVRAVTLGDSVATSAGDDDDAPAALDADEFEVTPLTDFLESPESPVQDDGDGLLPSYAPFAMPDRLGARVAVIASGTDVDSIPIGRTAVLDLATRAMELAPDVRGLDSVRFTWLGAHLLFETVDGTSGIAWMPFPLDAEAAPTPVAWEGAASVEFAGLIPGSDSFLATVLDASSQSIVLRVDPTENLVEPVTLAGPGAFSEFAISAEGMLAATRRAPDTGRRDIVVTQWDGAEPASWTVLTSTLDSACFDSAWAPADPDGVEPPRLAYVCENATNGRPDVLLWEGVEPPPAGTSAPVMEVLTGGAQTAVPDGTMDGLVVRSRLQWDPSGRIVVFGASNADDAFNAEAMTLLALDIDEQRAIPIYDGDNGLADLAHFSSVAPDPVLLVWDRSSSGVEDGSGRNAIQLVAADPSGSRTVRGVSLGRDLLVAYPLFLGGNSLFYP